MNDFAHLARAVARRTRDGFALLGSAFLVRNDGVFATTRSVVGTSDKDLSVLSPHVADVNLYQDTTDLTAKAAPATIIAADYLRNLVLLKVDAAFDGILPSLDGLDAVDVGESLVVVGFPHAPDNRIVLVRQSSELLAKAVLPSRGSHSKYGILNIQSRPGQSGSFVLSVERSIVAGVLIGDYADLPDTQPDLRGIDPWELHQASHCVSAEYVRQML